MHTSPTHASPVAATVLEVLPVTGLAYLEDDDHRQWAITKSTTGSGLDALRPGARVNLQVVQARDFEFVSAYTPLD